jgi:prepilin-type N-terminal cleavage/methylation domain-containing protein
MKKTSKGFTLVEIAIVLVIIGLLLGGILKGQEMITQAKIKNVIADMSGVSAAMYGYQDRYRALPGDDKGAAGRWGVGTTDSGTGDGVIQGVYNAPVPAVGSNSAANEASFFWHHLRLAGFIAGTGIQQPFNAVSGVMGVQTADGSVPGSATFIAGVLSSAAPVTTMTSLMLCSANLPDKIAISVDSQTDDGVGNTGTVRGLLQGAPNPPIPSGGAASAFVENGVNSYVVCRAL